MNTIHRVDWATAILDGTVAVPAEQRVVGCVRGGGG
jgi:hypothetical protein